MQTGFEMEMLTAATARVLMKGWPNQQELRGGLSWEVRTMEEAGTLLDFAKEPAKWGALNGKPIPPLPQTQGHRGIIMASPPITVTWQERGDRSSCLTVRCPITLWMEDDAMILPPDTVSGAFYLDPPDQPGLHRDLFKTWARKLLGELTSLNYIFTEMASAHLTSEYRSDSSCSEEPDERSRSSWGTPDSSDLEGAHKVDSSDEEGAHRPGWRPPGMAARGGARS